LTAFSRVGASGTSGLFDKALDASCVTVEVLVDSNGKRDAGFLRW
jgi:hypothetical protein